MIETVFSKSAYGSLKLAQNCGADKHSSASIGLVLSGRTNISPEELETLKADAELQAHRKWETSIPLGGNPADVYCIDVAWSMGDISDDEIGNNRKSVLEQAFFVWPNREDNEQYILETLRSAKTALHEILDRASRGEPVRIWYSHNPDEICGFYWLLAQLKKLPAIGSIYAVKLPEWEYSTDNTLCTHIGWGEISPEEWGKYLPLQREVKPALLNACAMRWKQLQQENAPLRIYLNGKLQSASENIYDSFILREVDEQADEFSEANLIGNVLGKNQLGIGDAWIALRMEKFIKEGMFTIVTTPSADDLIYHRTLRKCPYART